MAKMKRRFAHYRSYVNHPHGQRLDAILAKPLPKPRGAVHKHVDGACVRELSGVHETCAVVCTSTCRPCDEIAIVQALTAREMDAVNHSRTLLRGGFLPLKKSKKVKALLSPSSYRILAAAVDAYSALWQTTCALVDRLLILIHHRKGAALIPVRARCSAA